MTENDASFDTPQEINTAIREGLKQTRSLKITDMAGMHSIAVGITEVAKITVEGTAGNYFGAFNGAATLRLLGDAGKYTGDSMSGGILRVEGNCGFGTGTYLMGGYLDVTGNSGPATGQRMYDGIITIRGNAGAHCGAGMKGGMIFVRGRCGDGTGHHMEDGVIYARKFRSLGTNAMELPLTKIDKSRLIEYLEIDELEIEDYRKVVPKESTTDPGDESPMVLEDTPEEFLDRIILAPSHRMYTDDEVTDISGVDIGSSVGTGLAILKLAAPFIIYDTASTSPMVLREAGELGIPVAGPGTLLSSRLGEELPGDDPSGGSAGDEGSQSVNRIVRIPPEREGITADVLNRGRGIELVMGTGAGFFKGGELIASMPERQLDINSGDDVRTFIELLREVTRSSKTIFVTVTGENIYNLVVDLAHGKPDAIILRSRLPTPAIVVAREALEDAGRRDRIRLYLLSDLRNSEDLYKFIALGADGIALVIPDRGARVKKAREAFSLNGLLREFRMLMAYSGRHAMEDISPEDLRALSYSTAAVTGIKLIGYDQTLPIWRR